MIITSKNYKKRKDFCRFLGIDIDSEGCCMYLGFTKDREMILCGEKEKCEDCKERLLNKEQTPCSTN